jgi:hypothetical protein
MGQVWRHTSVARHRNLSDADCQEGAELTGVNQGSLKGRDRPLAFSERGDLILRDLPVQCFSVDAKQASRPFLIPGHLLERFNDGLRFCLLCLAERAGVSQRILINIHGQLIDCDYVLITENKGMFQRVL